MNLAWVYFRARSFSGANTLLLAMLGVGGRERVNSGDAGPVLICISLLLLLHHSFRNESWETLLRRVPGWVLGVGLGLLLLMAKGFAS